MTALPVMVTAHHGRRTGWVYSGATTPWSWSSLPGLGTGHGHLWEGGDAVPCGRPCGCYKSTLTSTRYDRVQP